MCFACILGPETQLHRRLSPALRELILLPGRGASWVSSGKKQNSTNFMGQLGSIPSRKQKGDSQRFPKWKVFNKKNGGAR